MLYFTVTEFTDIIPWFGVGLLLGLVVMVAVFVIRMGVIALKRAMGL